MKEDSRRAARPTSACCVVDGSFPGVFRRASTYRRVYALIAENLLLEWSVGGGGGRRGRKSTERRRFERRPSYPSASGAIASVALFIYNSVRYANVLCGAARNSLPTDAVTLWGLDLARETERRMGVLELQLFRPVATATTS